jgi:hypothetical protein
MQLSTGGDIVVMDNLSSHKVADVIDPIIEKGAAVLFLPLYSSDFNLIEMQWSNLPQLLPQFSFYNRYLTGLNIVVIINVKSKCYIR